MERYKEKERVGEQKYDELRNALKRQNNFGNLAGVDIELYDILLSAGMDLNTIKMMIQHKKTSSRKLKENMRKLHQESTRKWVWKHGAGNISDKTDVTFLFLIF